MSPSIMPSTLKKKFIVYLEQELIDYVETIAKRDEISRSNAVRRILKKGLLKS